MTKGRDLLATRLCDHISQRCDPLRMLISLLCGRLMKQLDAARQQVATAEQRADAAAAALTSALRMHAGLTSATERA